MPLQKFQGLKHKAPSILFVVSPSTALTVAYGRRCRDKLRLGKNPAPKGCTQAHAQKSNVLFVCVCVCVLGWAGLCCAVLCCVVVLVFGFRLYVLVLVLVLVCFVCVRVCASDVHLKSSQEVSTYALERTISNAAVAKSRALQGDVWPSNSVSLCQLKQEGGVDFFGFE